MGFRRAKKQTPAVDLTPMVDVVFLLLIFFMLSTTFIETPGIGIKLPESSSRREEGVPKELKAFLDKEGKLHLGERALTFEALEKELGLWDGDRETTSFIIYADRLTEHGSVVRLLDLAKKSGFRKLAIATEASR